MNISSPCPPWATVASDSAHVRDAFPTLHEAVQGTNHKFQTPFSNRNLGVSSTPTPTNMKKRSGKKGKGGTVSSKIAAPDVNASDILTVSARDVRDEYGSHAASKKVVDRVVGALPDGPDEDAECRRLWVVLLALMHNGFKANVDLVLKRYAEMFSRKRGGKWSSTLERKLRKCPGMMLLGEGPSATIQVNRELMNSYCPPLIDYTKMPDQDYHPDYLTCVTQSAMRAQCRMAGIFGLGETIMDMPSTKYWLPPTYRLAECCNMIHVCVVEKYLGYDDNGHLVPYLLSNSAVQDKLAELYVSCYCFRIEDLLMEILVILNLQVFCWSLPKLIFVVYKAFANHARTRLRRLQFCSIRAGVPCHCLEVVVTTQAHPDFYVRPMQHIKSI